MADAAAVVADALARFGGHPLPLVLGGEDGALGANYVDGVDGDVQALGHRGSVDIKAGETFVIETPGGGGYGEPAAK